MVKKVLVIDDDDVARELASSTLRDAGNEVFELPSPIGATQIIIEQGIDAIVLDLFMPGMNGDKFAKLVRGHRGIGKVSIVLVSGIEPSELLRTAKRIQADAVVSKADVRTNLAKTVQSL
jgi:CheY-like chemotaxis protein